MEFRCKQTIFTRDALFPTTDYPVVGRIECTVLSDRSADGVVAIKLWGGLMIGLNEDDNVFMVASDLVHE